MAIISGTALNIAGSIVGVGAGNTIGVGVHYSIEDKKKLDEQISTCKDAVQKFEKLRRELLYSKDYLQESKIDFLSGGHNFDGNVPANKDYDKCISKINDSINNVNKLIQYTNADIDKLVKERNNL